MEIARWINGKTLQLDYNMGLLHGGRGAASRLRPIQIKSVLTPTGEEPAVVGQFGLSGCFWAVIPAKAGIRS